MADEPLCPDEHNDESPEKPDEAGVNNSTARSRRWVEKNREHRRDYMREYMRAWRHRKRNGE